VICSVEISYSVVITRNSDWYIQVVNKSVRQFYPVYSHTHHIYDNINFEDFTGGCNTAQIYERICTFRMDILSSTLSLKTEVSYPSENSGCPPTKLRGVRTQKMQWRIYIKWRTWQEFKLRPL
jgi:hypothetical protein